MPYFGDLMTSLRAHLGVPEPRPWRNLAGWCMAWLFGRVPGWLRLECETKHPGFVVVGFRRGCYLDLESQDPSLTFLPAREIGGWVAMKEKT